MTGLAIIYDRKRGEHLALTLRARFGRDEIGLVYEGRVPALGCKDKIGTGLAVALDVSSCIWINR